MLVLSRLPGEKVVLAGGLIEVTIVSVKGNRVRIGFVCPKDITVDRKEVHDLKKKKVKT